jgi:L-threonylcarbamoyladenylate synthase
MIKKDSESGRLEAAEIIHRGGVIAFRTDTFYGLGADPFNRAAVARIRALKVREDSQPILILISDHSEVERFIFPSALFESVAAARWPAPLTLIGKARPEVPGELTAGTGTIGLRLPGDESLRDLLRACGGALTATSANLSGQPPARTSSEVEGYFAEALDLILAGGEVTVNEPSTVLDLSGSEARLIREGAISKAALSSYL